MTPPTWLKSSYSGDNGGNCLQVAPGFPGLVPVRDSKNPDGPLLLFPSPAWRAFLQAIRTGELPTP